MITGTVVELQARIQIGVRSRDGRFKTIEAVVDTGFDGSLSLPPILIAALGLSWKIEGKAILADGTLSEFDVFDGTAATEVMGDALMQELEPEGELAALLAKYQALGGVLDFVFLAPTAETRVDSLHRDAALAGIKTIDRRLSRWADSHASKVHPIEMFFRVRWDETKLAGQRVSFSTFWGTDDVEPKALGDRAWIIPNQDGYKTAFFHPPYRLHGTAHEKADVFAGLNDAIFGSDRENAEIFSWSTDWSNYFDAGNEWWGAFFGTIRPVGLRPLVVVGASSTD